MKNRIIASCILFCFSCCLLAQTNDTPLGYYPSHKPRMAAEWEPAIGVLIAWPLSLPKELVIELAKDTKIYLLVESHKAKQDAIQYLTQWKITPDRIKFITVPQGVDASWTRDWGPHAVFTPDGDLKLADPRYLFSTPLMGLSCDDSLRFLFHDDMGRLLLTNTEDQAPDFISAATEWEAVKLPFAFTGGNVLADGQRSAFSTCAIVRENEFDAVPEEQFFKGVRQILGIEDYHIISNYEAYGIQHIDCFMKLLDEERLLVARPPMDHPAYATYEGIVDHELRNLKNAYGRPYEILRIDLAAYDNIDLAAYTNSLILNKNIYVPLFGIAQDSVAMQTWRDAMPGYTVKGFLFPLSDQGYYRKGLLEQYKNMGWKSGDALHCRARAIWDPTMIYMSVDRLPAIVPKAKSYTINVLIKDYSKGSLVPEHLLLRWRIKGDTIWKNITLTPTGVPDQYQAILQGKFAGVTIEYYAEAKSNWGTLARMPLTAPEQGYLFKVN